MRKKVSTITVMFIIVSILGLYILIGRPTSTSGLASVTMLDVGQGDSFLIQASKGKQILIDGGKNSMVLSALSKAMPVNDHSIDVVIATHPDADHIGGLPLVFQRYKVGLFLTSEVNSDTSVTHSLYQEIKKNKTPAFYARRGMNIVLGQESVPSSTLAILFPDRSTETWKTNNASIVSRLDIKNGDSDRSVLFTGDSPTAIEHFLVLGQKGQIDVDILKLGHHGSKTSSSDEFLRWTSPVLALISVGKNNSYGHPSAETLDLLGSLSIPYVSTADHGNVTLLTDGKKWQKTEEH